MGIDTKGYGETRVHCDLVNEHFDVSTGNRVFAQWT